MDGGAIVAIGLAGFVVVLFVRAATRRHRAAQTPAGTSSNGTMLGTLGRVCIAVGIAAIVCGALLILRALGGRGPELIDNTYLSIGADSILGGIIIMLAGAFGTRLDEHIDTARDQRAATHTEMAAIHRALRVQIVQRERAGTLARLITQHPEAVATLTFRYLVEAELEGSTITELRAVERAIRDDGYRQQGGRSPGH